MSGRIPDFSRPIEYVDRTPVGIAKKAVPKPCRRKACLVVVSSLIVAVSLANMDFNDTPAGELSAQNGEVISNAEAGGGNAGSQSGTAPLSRHEIKRRETASQLRDGIGAYGEARE